MILSAMTGKFPDYAKVVQYFLIFARFKTDIINKSRLDIMKKTALTAAALAMVMISGFAQEKKDSTVKKNSGYEFSNRFSNFDYL